MKIRIYNIVFFFIWTVNLHAQDCSVLGQNPSSAFPVCGSGSFSQVTVPLCGGRRVPGPCTDGGETDINPFWYKFTCFQTGSLRLLITPNDLGDDYDWQIFDITGHQPDDVFRDASLFVACNWSGNSGLTGTSPSGNGLINCGGYSYPTFSAMPTLQTGHNYLLLISHFTRSQSGYKLDFSGGNAVITDTLKAAFKNVNISCDGKVLNLSFNKKMQCSSLDKNGSDFKINSSATIIDAFGYGCQSGFDLDSITLSMSSPLLPGNYTVSMQIGNDGNTLLDACNTPMDIGSSINFTVFAGQPPVLDSISFSKCPPDIITVSFDKKILCSSVDPDGTDFKIIGPSLVSVVNVTSQCDNTGGALKFDIHLNAPIQQTGTYQLILLKGNDGNSVNDICGDEALTTTKNFYIPPVVSAKFEFSSKFTCNSDSVSFTNSGDNLINRWTWTANGQVFGNTRTAAKLFPADSIFHIKLFVANDGCEDVQDTIIFFPHVKAEFNYPEDICPGDTLFVSNISKGNINSYNWDFGNGTVSKLKNPLGQIYPSLNKEHYYTIYLSISATGCIDTISHKFRVLTSCYIDVPNTFTPNGDGINDYFYPLNAIKAANLNFAVYNRWGNKVFESHDWKKKWDGRFKGELQPAGIYIWTLSYVNTDTQKSYNKKGTVFLAR